MRVAKADVPVRLRVPGAVARQTGEFGEAAGLGKMAGEYFSLAAGTDIAPLLKGLHDDLCQTVHWGYMLQGRVTVTYKGGASEAVSGGDLFYWPPGHTVRVDEDAEIILFSPLHEHAHVIEHMRAKLGA